MGGGGGGGGAGLPASIERPEEQANGPASIERKEQANGISPCQHREGGAGQWDLSLPA